ncbi:protein FAM210B, mitochondrial [Colossoma macropomum]|uniref:protein FAM210B, mitochondrial n=1 Tax=Colossoma macropomum TaxID=42526 RepID=UPI001863BB0B|nr:protein FAM210B, mitochondrial [Colossoma macropomum]
MSLTSAGQSPLRVGSEATMFFCGGARFVGSVSCKFRYNFAGTAQVGTNLPRAVTWALRDKLKGICCPRVHDRCINSSHALCVISQTLGDNIVKSTGRTFSLTPGQVTRAQKISMFALKSGSPPTFEFTIICFPWVSKGRKTIHMPEHFFLRSTEMGTTRSSMDKVLSRAVSTSAKQKPAKGEPTIEDKKVQPSTSPKRGDEEPENEKNQSKTMQLKKVFKEYGAVGVSFHIGISLISLGIFYLAVSSGINMAVVLCKMGFSESVVQSKMAAGTSTFVLAYAIHKLFAPLRISITLVSVPLIVRYLRKTGLFKPPPTSP